MILTFFTIQLIYIFIYKKMFEAIIYLLQGKTEENEKYKQ